MVSGIVITKVPILMLGFSILQHMPVVTEHCLPIRRHEMEKRRQYEDRVIQVEHGVFTPLVFSTAGSVGPAATIVLNRLSSLLATKWNIGYNKIISWIRCKIGFALNHSAIMCLRGTRSRRPVPELDPHNVDLALHQSRITA